MTQLHRDLIADTLLWHVSICIAQESIHVLLTGPESVEQSVMFHTIALKPGSASHLAAVEEAVYDNQLLLADFASVNVMVDTPNFTILPAEVAAKAGEIIEAMIPDLDAPFTVTQRPLDPAGTQILAAATPTDLLNFINRTWAHPTIDHPLAATARYLALVPTHGSGSALYGVISAGRMMAVRYGANGTPDFANRFEINAPADAAYYLLALSAGVETLVVGGDADLRNEASSLLRSRLQCPVLPITLSPELLQLQRMAPAAPLYLLFTTRL
jgi:hypothetical protein